MHRLICMKECLVKCAEAQMDRLEEVDAKELGEVIDMIKDLEEAIYYHTISKSMTESKGEHYTSTTTEHHYATNDWDMGKNEHRSTHLQEPKTHDGHSGIHTGTVGTSHTP